MTAAINLRPFTSSDWDCYQGCESKNPMIGTFSISGHEAEIVVDGNYAEFTCNGVTYRTEDAEELLAIFRKETFRNQLMSALGHGLVTIVELN